MAVSENEWGNPPHSNEIKMEFSCERCRMAGHRTPQLDVGWTEWGIQIWCRRHGANVAHISFMGQDVAVNETAPGWPPLARTKKGEQES